jgi:predicted aconitase
MLAELSDVDDGEALVLGCPQLTLEEVEQISHLIKNRRFKGKALLFISRYLYQEGLRKGRVQGIERAGGMFLCDSCGDLSLAVKGLGTDKIVTDTVKGAYYMRHTHRLKVALQSLENIMKTWLI